MSGKSIRRCGGIIYNSSNDKVLIVLNRESYEKGENKWGFPKGHRNYNERIVDCAQREIKEETGLTIPKCLFKRKVCLNNTLYYIINLKQDYKEFDIIDKKEIVKVEWSSPHELMGLCYNRDIRQFLRKYATYEPSNMVKEKEQLYTMINNTMVAI